MPKLERRTDADWEEIPIGTATKPIKEHLSEIIATLCGSGYRVAYDGVSIWKVTSPMGKKYCDYRITPE